MTLDIVVGFFILGAVAQLFKSDFKLPSGLYQSCVIFLLLAIGLKGGIALSQQPFLEVLPKALAVLAFGFFLPFLAYPILRWIGGWSQLDAAATAAHYGSVSVATYAVGVALLESSGVPYEEYFPLFVALLEVPAILVGIMLAKESSANTNRLSALLDKKLLHEIFLNQGVLLLLGGLAIGAWAGQQQSAKVMPFFGTLFHGILALFLLEMGRVAASKFRDLKDNGAFLCSFGVIMPLIGAAIAGLLGTVLGLSPGGVFLLAVLGSSASYIAVPAALAVALPKANASISITASLAVTFPFNVLVALPVYFAIIQA